MPDEIDRAQAINEQHQAAAMASYRRSREEAQAGRTHCVDCEEEIPPRRREAVASCQRCLACQRIYEGERP